MRMPLAPLPETRLPSGGTTKTGVVVPLLPVRIVRLAGVAIDEPLTADLVAARRGGDPNTVLAVGNGELAADVGADAVGANQVAGRSVEADAVAGVARDHVCDGTRRSRRIEADSVVRRLRRYVDAVAGLPKAEPAKFRPM